MRNNQGEFVVGERKLNLNLPVGTIRVRTRHKRRGEKRAFIKVAEPNDWQLMARHVWEQTNGPIPVGMGIHHRDENKLNDSIENLELVSKSEHLARHYADYKDRLVANLAEHRRIKPWSTKSKTKRTGRPPAWTDEQLKMAIGEWFSGGGTFVDIGSKHGIPARTLAKKIKAIGKGLKIN